MRGVRRSPRNGFGLVELMIVLVIVAILSTMTVAGYRTQIHASHAARAGEVLKPHAGGDAIGGVATSRRQPLYPL